MAKFGEDSAASCAALNVAVRDKGAADEADMVEGFAALVHRQSQFVFRVAFSVLRNVQDAEDVVQETFLKIYKLGDWSGIQDERAFLARAAWRLAVSRVRRVAGKEVVGEAVDLSLNAEDSLIKEATDAALHKLVDALPLELRLPLALSTVDGMKSAEIAKVMGIPEGTVRTRMMRAREILRKKLEVQRGR